MSGDGHWEARSVVDSVEQSEGNQDTRIYEFEDNEGGEGPLSPENSQGLFLCFLIALIRIKYSMAYYQNFTRREKKFTKQLEFKNSNFKPLQF